MKSNKIATLNYNSKYVSVEVPNGPYAGRTANVSSNGAGEIFVQSENGLELRITPTGKGFQITCAKGHMTPWAVNGLSAIEVAPKYSSKFWVHHEKDDVTHWRAFNTHDEVNAYMNRRGGTYTVRQGHSFNQAWIDDLREEIEDNKRMSREWAEGMEEIGNEG